jgi:hypothetical protein
VGVGVGGGVRWHLLTLGLDGGIELVVLLLEPPVLEVGLDLELDPVLGLATSAQLVDGSAQVKELCLVRVGARVVVGLGLGLGLGLG